MYQNPYLQYPQIQSNQFSGYQSSQYINQNLIRVNGIDGAKAYQMNPNSTVALFDSNEDIMYIKSTDGAGFPQIRKFSFIEMNEIPTKQINNDDFISREEFENFKKEVLNNGKQSIRKSESTQ